MFSVLDIDEVHGDHEVRVRHNSEISIDSLPQVMRGSLRDQGVKYIGTATLIHRGLGAFWEIRNTDGGWIGRANFSGELAGHISQDQAQQLTKDDFLPEAPVRSIQLIKENPPSEYRGGRLPLHG